MDGLEPTLSVKKTGNYAHQPGVFSTQQQAHREELQQCAMALELAASLRAGCMDSESRAQEVQKQIRLTLVDVAARLRTLSGL